MCFPWVPAQFEGRGDLDLGLVPGMRSPCCAAAVSWVLAPALARLSLGNSSSDAGGLSTGFVANSLLNS
eukprot:11332909-Heterocapsa_arctica.AAC.1